jgi:hypothetical protein
MEYYIWRLVGGGEVLYRASEDVDGLLQVFDGRGWAAASGDEFAMFLGGEFAEISAAAAARVEASLRGAATATA